MPAIRKLQKKYLADLLDSDEEDEFDGAHKDPFGVSSNEV
jgi:hypothetical protein